MSRLTLRDISTHKNATPLVVITSYTPPVARLFDPHVDILLVGDSLGMVQYGFESTLPVTLDMMIAHGAAVRRATTHALVVVDMPFGSYQQSPGQAFENCARVMKEASCDAVKLEGGEAMASTIEFLVARGIPVMAHVGLQPQQVNTLGGYRYQGRTEDEQAAILRDAKAVEKAGAFAVVLEGIAEPLAVEITKTLAIPTIGIGASAACDGQVLVAEDMLGLTASGYVPGFVKQYAQLSQTISTAAENYAKEVRKRTFPAPEHTYGKKG
ncbi:MAG: 3-methyl-2-oxobutanoate hydroxymethyltransferase [Alphaproteobacteria bacterium]|nr:3-methyl-2-oxobutanoate hydroxymethyltransferase [Alphaproteobacteria bacterium]